MERRLEVFLLPSSALTYICTVALVVQISIFAFNYTVATALNGDLLSQSMYTGTPVRPAIRSTASRSHREQAARCESAILTDIRTLTKEVCRAMFNRVRYINKLYLRDQTLGFSQH